MISSRLIMRYGPRILPRVFKSTYRTISKSPPIPNTQSSQLSTVTTIIPGSQYHSSLPTFLTHARSTNLSPNSPVYIGTYYEYIVLSALAPLGFSLVRTGRTSDNGIDLLGTWSLPHMAAPMRVLIQCKSHVRPLRPEHVRELEGAVAGAPSGWKDALGILVSPREASKGVRERVGTSKYPVGYLMVDGNGNGNNDVANAASGAISEPGIQCHIANGTETKIDELVTREGKVRQFLWNWVAQEHGLEGLGATVKYNPTKSAEGTTLDREIALTWNGWIIKRMPEGMNQESLIPPIPAELSEPIELPTPKKRGRPRKKNLDLENTISSPQPRGQKKKK